MVIHHHQLHMFTQIKLEGASRLLAVGKKDSAREIVRWVRNARIVEILKPYSGELLIDAYRLDSWLRELERACHPMALAPCPSDSLSVILERLNLIAGLLVHQQTGISVKPTDLAA